MKHRITRQRAAAAAAFLLLAGNWLEEIPAYSAAAPAGNQAVYTTSEKGDEPDLYDGGAGADGEDVSQSDPFVPRTLKVRQLLSPDGPQPDCRSCSI